MSSKSQNTKDIVISLFTWGPLELWSRGAGLWEMRVAARVWWRCCWRRGEEERRQRERPGAEK